MSFGARGQARSRILRRATWIVAALVLVALLFLFSGHWIIGIVLALAAVAAVWVLLQLRTVR